ncbi:MAG: hypothetical protein V7459_04040 [Oceanicoccus sp.]
MHLPRYNILILLAAICLWNTPVVAQGLDAELRKLATYEQQLTELRTSQQRSQKAIQENNSDLSTALNQESPEKNKLAAAKLALDEAKNNFELDPSPANKSKMKNVEFQYVLAERKFKKVNNKPDALKTKQEALNVELARINSDISLLSNTISDQQLQIEKTRARSAATEQSRRTEQQRLKEAAASAEIARLKAKIAQQERNEQQRIELAMKNAELQLEAEEAQAAAEKQAIEKVEEVPASQQNLSTPVAKTLTEADNIAEKSESTIVQLRNSDDVAAIEQKIADILNQPKEKKSSRYNKILNVKTISDQGKSGRAKSNTLRALGHNIYRGTALLNGGDTMFIVGFNNWRQVVPIAATTKTEFTFIYDGSDPKKPLLTYFLSSLAK